MGEESKTRRAGATIRGQSLPKIQQRPARSDACQAVVAVMFARASRRRIGQDATQDLLSGEADDSHGVIDYTAVWWASHSNTQQNEAGGEVAYMRSRSAVPARLEGLIVPNRRRLRRYIHSEVNNTSRLQVSAGLRMHLPSVHRRIHCKDATATSCVFPSSALSLGLHCKRATWPRNEWHSSSQVPLHATLYPYHLGPQHPRADRPISRNFSKPRSCA